MEQLVGLDRCVSGPGEAQRCGPGQHSRKREYQCQRGRPLLRRHAEQSGDDHSGYESADRRSVHHGAQSQLVIGGPYTLQVLLDTTLSAGTLTMLPGGILATGSYTQTGGLLQFQLAPSGSGRVEVANVANLGGTLGVGVTPGLYGLSTSYTLVSAGTISGQFAQFISSPPSAFLSLSGPVYSPTSVDVTLTRTPFGAVAGLTQNQRAVGNALEGAYATTLTGPAATLYTNLLMTGTPNALSQLSGEGITAAQNAAFASGRMFDSLMMDQGAFWRSGETADSEGVTYRETPRLCRREEADTGRLHGAEGTLAGLSAAELAGVDRRFRRRAVA